MPPGPFWGKPERRVPAAPSRSAGTPGYVPPGWPDAVRPPGAPDWERTATAFLLDCCPPDVRLHPVLSRHAVLLARFAAEAVDGQLAACTSGIRECRASLADHLPAGAIDEAASAWNEIEAGLQRTRREVALVEEALRGGVFVRKL